MVSRVAEMVAVGRRTDGNTAMARWHHRFSQQLQNTSEKAKKESFKASKVLQASNHCGTGSSTYRNLFNVAAMLVKPPKRQHCRL